MYNNDKAPLSNSIRKSKLNFNKEPILSFDSLQDYHNIHYICLDISFAEAADSNSNGVVEPWEVDSSLYNIRDQAEL